MIYSCSSWTNSTYQGQRWWTSTPSPSSSSPPPSLCGTQLPRPRTEAGCSVSSGVQSAIFAGRVILKDFEVCRKDSIWSLPPLNTFYLNYKPLGPVPCRLLQAPSTKHKIFNHSPTHNSLVGIHLFILVCIDLNVHVLVLFPAAEQRGGIPSTRTCCMHIMRNNWGPFWCVNC